MSATLADRRHVRQAELTIEAQVVLQEESDVAKRVRVLTEAVDREVRAIGSLEQMQQHERVKLACILRELAGTVDGVAS